MDAHREIESLLAQIRVRAKDDPIVERASDQISVLCRGYMEPDQMLGTETVMASLTPKQRDMFQLLMKRRGQTVSKSALIDSSFRHQDNEPAEKVIDVQICKMRKRLKNTEYDIETVWGTGYRLKPPKVNPVSLAHADRMMSA